MAITVPFDLGYEFEVKSKLADVFALLSDVPASAAHFPKVAKLVDLGDQTYRWEMEKVGVGQMSIQTVYAARYVRDKKKGSIVWSPVPDEGNAQISGSWTLTANKQSTKVALAIRGELTLPMPALMKKLIAPLVIAENEKLIEKYIDNLIAQFGGEV